MAFLIGLDDSTAMRAGRSASPGKAICASRRMTSGRAVRIGARSRRMIIRARFLPLFMRQYTCLLRRDL